jgi:D-beta-D-heptose 7-phosphate kinase/D-beta-D-heptose 1-phosphate adenosyltransferase
MAADTTLLELVRAFPRFRVAVVGDLMLDRYTWGRASRISEEAPVPVVVVERETETPGGAANVTHNVLGLGAQVAAFGVVGADPRGDALTQTLRDKGADVTGILRAHDRPTTVKTRIIANHQQVVRIDREDTSPLAPQLQAQLEAQISAAITGGQIQALVFEDYAKGLLAAPMMQRLVDLARQHRVITVLDPHPCHPFNVTGLDLMTPNRNEAFGLAGVYYQRGVLPLEQDTPLFEVSRKLDDLWHARNLLVTLGAGGMALFSHGQPPLHIPTQAREVFDVSGAGDTVTATCALALAAGASPAEAARLANHAAGIVVAKIGTVPITTPELLDTLT